MIIINKLGLSPILPRLTYRHIMVFMMMMTTLSAIAGPGIWTSNGPEGGRVDGLIASPNTANTFYAATRGGVFKTLDGGVTWIESNAGINRQLVGTLLHSQTATDTLYAFGARFVYFSNDGAASWQDRSPLPGVIVDNRISAATLSAVFPGRIYIGLGDGTILRSDDAGLNWLTVASIPLTDFSILAMAAHPTDPDTLLVSTGGTFLAANERLFRGTSAGMSWAEIPCPMVDCPWEFQGFTSIQFAGSTGKIWATSQGNGVSRSLDFGNTWTPANTFATRPSQFIMPNPSNPNEVFTSGRLGLGYSLDDGLTWVDVFSGFTGNSALLPTRSTQLAYDPFNPTLQLSASIGNGVYRRTSPSLDAWAPGIDGFNAANIRAIDTTLGNRVHAGIGDSFGATFSNFRSTNNGLSWNQANSGLDADQLRDLTVDPNDITVVYGSGRYLANTDGTGMNVPGNGGIYKSTDSGITWSTIDNGIPVSGGDFSTSFFGTVRSIEVDRFSSTGGASQVIYAGGSGRFFLEDDGMGGTMVTQLAARIYKSIDAGATWVAAENGLGQTELATDGRLLFASVVQVIQDQSDITGNTLYSTTFIGGLTDAETPTVIDNGVFKTIDGGANWIHMSNGLPKVNGNPAATEANILSLAIDPTDPTGQTLYASSNDFGNSFGGSVYKTIDGGNNWFFSGTGLSDRDVRDIIVDPATGDVYIAAADIFSNGDGGIFVSSDGGATWSSISVGFPSSAVALKIALDNTGTNLVIHAGTTRSVQSFEALPDDETDGATNAQEIAAPNSGDGNLDGTQDSTQASVASPSINDTVRGTQSYITASITPIVGNCNRLENSFGLDLLTSIPNEISYDTPFNGIHLRIPDCEQAELELIYHAGDFSNNTWQIRTYGIAFPDEDRNGWFQIPATNVGNTWTIQLTDGAIGDSTPQDNIIVFDGAAATLTEFFFNDGMEVE